MKYKKKNKNKWIKKWLSCYTLGFAGAGSGGGGWVGCCGMWVGGCSVSRGSFSPIEMTEHWFCFSGKKTHWESWLVSIFFFWNGLFFMDGLKYMCRHLLSFFKTSRLCASFVNRVLWVPADILLLYRVQREGDLIPMVNIQFTGCHNLLFLSLGRRNQNVMHLYCNNESAVQKMIKKRLFDGLLVTKTQVDVLFTAPLVVHSFLWLHCFQFVWLFFFLLICLWFLTGTGGDFLCVGGVGSSLWPLWPPMSVFRQLPPSPPPPVDIFLGMRTEHKYKLLQFSILCLFVSFCSLRRADRNEKKSFRHDTGNTTTIVVL